MNLLEKKRRTAKSEMSYRGEPAVKELLDHIAEELAAEYVRLMKGDAGEPAVELATNRNVRRKAR